MLVLVGALLFGSIPATADENHGREKALPEAARDLEQELLPLAGDGFVGIAASEAECEIIVFVEDEQARRRVPRSFEGYTVQTEVTGKIQTLSTEVLEPLADVSEERQGEVSPLVGGISLSRVFFSPVGSMTAILVVISQSVFDVNYRAAQIPFVFLSAVLPVLAYLIASRISGIRRHAWIAALLTIFSPF